MPLREKVESLANRIGIWGTFFGTVWGAMSWVASNVTPLADFGWGTFVFLGLGAACILSLALSVSLVAWRYFRPLQLPSILAETTNAAPIDQKLADMTTTYVNLAKDANLRLSKLESSNAGASESERDLLHLLDFGVYQTTLVMLRHLVDQIPGQYNVDPNSPFPAEFANTKARNDADIYLDSVRRMICDGSERARSYESLWFRAEAEADTLLRQTPTDQRPAGIDPLVLRDFAISFRRALLTASFLRSQHREIERIVIQHRSTMIERFQKRQKQ